ncbi:hypothetical protein C5167_002298 [Papaver somniferum]|uniref:Uncharacterized protein n=1 Tax=Papaver somniferum TaxID=3469 RepID=A0A4Y7KZC0_PAPSO|nr:hypothetical protein C5167_002298 [Papaver somniferum]
MQYFRLRVRKAINFIRTSSILSSDLVVAAAAAVTLLLYVQVNMDKSWVDKDPASLEYEEGLNAFLDYSYIHGKLNREGN